MKKICMVLSVLLVTLLVACGSSAAKPEDVVSGYLDATKAMDTAKINQYLVSDGSSEEDSSSQSPESEEIGKLITANMQYKIVSSNVAEDTATVTTEITNIDMSTVMQEVIQQAFADAMSGELSSGEGESHTLEVMKASVEKHKDDTVTTSVNVQLKKVDGAWKIEPDAAFMSAVTGSLQGSGETDGSGEAGSEGDSSTVS